LGISRDRILVYVWGPAPAIPPLRRSLTGAGFTIKRESPDLVYDGEKAKVIYGGAKDEEVDAVIAMLTHHFPATVFARDKVWADTDRDIYIQIPLNITMDHLTSVIYFDPSTGCHHSLPSDEFRALARTVIARGGHLVKGIFSPHTPHKVISKEEDI
jgi:hypothetical protein